MIVIAGAGPAGIAAALAARKRGADVTVLDDNRSPGGQIWRGAYEFGDSGIRFIPGTRIISGDPIRRTLRAETPDGALDLGYHKLILATGARELFLPFPGWTLPGITGVGGLQALAKGGLPLRRKRVVVAGSGPLLLAAAAYFRKAGADVALIAEQALPSSLAGFARELVRHPAKLLQAAALQRDLLGVPYRLGCTVERAEAGRLWFRGARGRSFHEEADYAAIAWGLVPNTELAELLGCRISAGAVDTDQYQRTSLADIYCAGEATGIGGVDVASAEGEIAACAALDDTPAARRLFSARARHRRFAAAANRAFAPRAELRSLPADDTVVCRCEDVTFARLREARGFREAKLHTRCGMGPCQGRVCGAATEFLFGWGRESARPPVLAARVENLICSSANPTG